MLEHSSLQKSDPCDITKGCTGLVTADRPSHNRLVPVGLLKNNYCHYYYEYCEAAALESRMENNHPKTQIIQKL